MLLFYSVKRDSVGIFKDHGCSCIHYLVVAPCRDWSDDAGVPLAGVAYSGILRIAFAAPLIAGGAFVYARLFVRRLLLCHSRHGYAFCWPRLFASVSKMALSVFVCKSKMDQRRFGLVKYLACTGSRLCAWSIIRTMLVLDRFDASPFDASFVNEKGLPMTYSYWHDELRFAIKEARLDHLRYNIHSFRRGGASAAFEAQVEERVMMFGGDWRDTRSLDAYVVCEVNIMLLRLSRSIASAKPVFDSVFAARSRRARQLSGVLDQSSVD
jgi:hypothetical protein